ncbi:flagellar hook-length control protein FliK [Collimonas arenae]|uniref:flagellar hook-length control protein FliK n=1 Tax=Collimonas arenae TaxID=279058 RepID=UPI000FE13CFB|nr:flagellar hook-length control protein FliK [Collimonas arenae]
MPLQLAAALSRAVSDSGLFYEAHLLQFATGMRSLAQLAQEPQASLGKLLQQYGIDGTEISQQRGGAKQPAEMHATAADAPVAAQGKIASLQAGLPSTAEIVPTSGTTQGTRAPAPEASPSHSPANSEPTDNGGQAAPANPRMQAVTVDIAAAYRAGAAAAIEVVHSRQERGASPSLPADADPVPTGPTGPTVTGMVHPDAVPLVRQQLEMLALSQFRWAGEAWPGAKAEWEIQEHDRRQDGSDNADTASRRWSTRLAMTLPRLGQIELRLTMLGASWHAQLAAVDEASLVSMRADSDQLRRRFQAAGMHLTELQLQQLSVSTVDNTASGKNDDIN